MGLMRECNWSVRSPVENRCLVSLAENERSRLALTRGSCKTSQVPVSGNTNEQIFQVKIKVEN